MSLQSSKKVNGNSSSNNNNRRKKVSSETSSNSSSSVTKPLLGSKSSSATSSTTSCSKNGKHGSAENADLPGGEPGGNGSDSSDPTKNSGGIFRPLVVLALPGDKIRSLSISSIRWDSFN